MAVVAVAVVKKVTGQVVMALLVFLVVVGMPVGLLLGWDPRRW